jgi:predicted small metal-binding protein
LKNEDLAPAEGRVRQEVRGMVTFACKDVGMQCNFKANAKTEAELMEQIKDHAAKVHNLKEIPPDLAQKIKGAIKK